MSPDERFGLIMFGLGLLATIMGWGVRAIWAVSRDVQQIRDDLNAAGRVGLDNTTALGKLTEAVWGLTERMARVEGRRRRW